MLVVADANELFSALIAKGKSLELFFDERLEIVSPEFILEEFGKYAEILSKKSGLVELELHSLLSIISSRIKFFKIEEFSEFLNKAKEICPDIKDIEYFALALKLNCPLWSEDKSLKKQKLVKVLTTSELLCLF